MATITPNFSLTGNPLSFSMPTNVSTTTPTTNMGAPAKAPMTAPPTNTIPANQVKPASQTQTAPTSSGTNAGTPAAGTSQTASANYGLLGNPQALASYQGLQNIGTQDSPAVQAARQDLLNFQAATADLQGRTAQGGYTLPILTGIQSQDENAYSQILAQKTANLQAALNEQSQQIGALGAAGNLAQTQNAPQGSYGISPLTGQPATPGAPTQVAPGNFYLSTNPQTGQAYDSSGGAANPFAGGQRQAQVAQGGTYQTNKGYLDSARNLVQQFNSGISQYPDFQPNSVALGNLFLSTYQGQTSNSQYPALQASFNNALNQYQQILGQQAFNAVLAQNKGSTLSSILTALDAQAQSVQAGQFAAGTGASSPPPPTTYVPPPAPSSQGTVNNGDTHTYKGVTYVAKNGMWVKQ